MREEAEDILRQVHKYFRYEAEKVEHWTSHAEKVKNRIRFRDDCDGFALTCAELLLDAGADPSKVFLVICAIGGVSHMVCALEEDDNTWIMDNNSAWLRSWHEVPYKWKKAMPLNKLGEWHSVKNG